MAQLFDNYIINTIITAKNFCGYYHTASKTSMSHHSDRMEPYTQQYTHILLHEHPSSFNHSHNNCL